MLQSKQKCQGNLRLKINVFIFTGDPVYHDTMFAFSPLSMDYIETKIVMVIIKDYKVLE